MNDILPKSKCLWLKSDGEFIDADTGTHEHIDYVKKYATHIKIVTGGKYVEAIEQFMRERKWIRVRSYGDSKNLSIHGIKPFSKAQRNTFKDLEIFGYTIIFN